MLFRHICEPYNEARATSNEIELQKPVHFFILVHFFTIHTFFIIFYRSAKRLVSTITSHYHYLL